MMMFENPFLLMALLAGLLASITSGIVGTYVVVKRIVFIAGSIAHSVLGGMGLCLWLKETYGLTYLHPTIGALLSALLSSLLMGWIHLNAQEREDTVIATLWASGMAVGVIFVSLTPSYSVELVHFLFGNILWVSSEELWLLSCLGGAVIIITLLWHKKFTTLCFDEVQLLLQGVSRKGLYFLLLSLIALSVVLLIQVVGALLVIALLAVPPAISGMLTHRLSTMFVFSVLLSSLFSFFGIVLSHKLNWPPGATIAALAAFTYLSLSFRHLVKRGKKESSALR